MTWWYIRRIKVRKLSQIPSISEVCLHANKPHPVTSPHEPSRRAHYHLVMANWVTISSLATAGGTLVLAVATFSSVRSASRSAKVSERAFLAANLPLLVPSQLTDPPEKVRFQDDHWVKLQGGHAYADATDGAIYFAIALRNASQGLALLDRWRVDTSSSPTDFNSPPPDPLTFRRLTRDLYITADGLLAGYYPRPARPAVRTGSHGYQWPPTAFSRY